MCCRSAPASVDISAPGELMEEFHRRASGLLSSSSINTRALRAALKAVGSDVAVWAQTGAERLGTLTGVLVDKVNTVLTCDYDGSVSCQTKNPDWPLGETLFLFGGCWVGAFIIANILVKVPLPGVILTSVLAVLGAIMLSYNLPVGCIFKFPPAVPLCLWDDVYEAVKTYVIPVHVKWPAAFVQNSTRVDGKLIHFPTDCATDPLGFTDGIRSLVWMMEAAAPGWQSVVPFGGAAASSYYVGKDVRESPYLECGIMSSINVVPLIAVAAIGFVVLSGIAHASILFILSIIPAVVDTMDAVKMRYVTLEATLDMAEHKADVVKENENKVLRKIEVAVEESKPNPKIETKVGPTQRQRNIRM